MSSGLQKSPRILIVRLSAIGDVIHSLPVLNALRAAMPGAMLAWAVESPAAPILRDHPSLDELIVLPRGWLKFPRGVWKLRQKLRRLAFDVTIDPQSLTKSALVAWFSGAPRRIGFGDDKGRELSTWLNTELVSTKAAHVIDCNLALLKPLGVVYPEVEYRIHENDDDGAFARAVIRDGLLESGFAIINTGAGWASKRWPLERHAGVARHLGRHHGLPSLVVWAGEEERRMAEQVVANSAGYAQLAPETSLGELAALQRRARIFVSSDTGPLHLAVAVGTPSVALHGTTSAKRNGPYGPGHIALQATKLERPLLRNRKRSSNELVKAIAVEQVCTACDEILSGRGQDVAA
jgi:lipopolysaccharide heptosyltransferase I